MMVTGTEPQPRIVINLQRKIPVNALRIVYGVNHEPGSIHAPSSIEVAFSNNNKQYGNPHKFSGFDDHADGLGLYEIDRRTTVINIPEQRAQFVRIDFQGKQGWIFLSEIFPRSGEPRSQSENGIRQMKFATCWRYLFPNRINRWNAGRRS